MLTSVLRIKLCLVGAARTAPGRCAVGAHAVAVLAAARTSRANPSEAAGSRGWPLAARAIPVRPARVPRAGNPPIPRFALQGEPAARAQRCALRIPRFALVRSARPNTRAGGLGFASLTQHAVCRSEKHCEAPVSRFPHGAHSSSVGRHDELGRRTTVLFERRPDLGEIDLNCANAETPIPHIDIVCELLEEAIAPDAGFPFTGAIAAGKPSAVLLAAIRAKFEVADTEIGRAHV